MALWKGDLARKWGMVPVPEPSDPEDFCLRLVFRADATFPKQMQPERAKLQEKVVKRKKSEEIHKIDAEFHRYSGLKSNQTNWFFPDSAHSHAQAFICLF